MIPEAALVLAAISGVSVSLLRVTIFEQHVHESELSEPTSDGNVRPPTHEYVDENGSLTATRGVQKRR